MPTPYRFRTGHQLRSGTTYSSTSSVHARHRQHDPDASGGIWQNTKVNPVAPTKCGLNVALVLDVSGSVTGSLPGPEGLRRPRSPTPWSAPRPSLALFTFATTAPAAGANNAEPAADAGVHPGRRGHGQRLDQRVDRGVAPPTGTAASSRFSRAPRSSTSRSSSPTATRPSTETPRARATTPGSVRSRTASSRPTRSKQRGHANAGVRRRCRHRRRRSQPRGHLRPDVELRLLPDRQLRPGRHHPAEPGPG